MDVQFTSESEVERERAIGTLVLAFMADPFVRWISPEASQYLNRFPEALQAFGGVAFGQGGAWRLGDFAAVALRLPTGIEPGGDATVALFQAQGDPQSRFRMSGDGGLVTVPRVRGYGRVRSVRPLLPGSGYVA